MSYRSLRALAICLHGKPGSCGVLAGCSSTLSRRCLSPAVDSTAAGENGYSSFVQRTVTAAAHDVIDLTTSEQRQRHSSNKSRVQTSTPNSDLDNHRIRKHATPMLQPTARVGLLLQVPSFVHDAEDLPTAHDLHDEELEQKYAIQSKKNKTIAQPYKEWEELHDHFVDVQRTRPHETASIFYNQRAFAKQFVGDFAHGTTSALEFRCKLSALSTRERRKLLPSLLIGSLVDSAAQCLFVLSNVRYHLSNSFRIQMNCLRAVRIMYRRDLKEQPELKHEYERAIEGQRSPENWPKDKFPAVLLQNLLLWSTPDQCESIIREFSNIYPDAEATSILAIVEHYLRIEAREKAFEQFMRLPLATLQNPSPSVKDLRDRLLKLDVVVKNENGTNFKYLPQILAHGMPSDESLHNIVIESAILNDAPDVAWDVFQYLENSPYQANARTHLVLLRDAFQRGDFGRVDWIMTAIHHREDLARDQYLIAYAMNIVRNIRCQDKRLGIRAARSHIMALYDRAYDRTPLIGLGIATASESNDKLLAPSPTLLAFTVWTFILIQSSSREVLRLWGWIKHLIAQRNEAVVESAKFDIIYNGLILFLARHPTTLSHALEVIQYMLSSPLCRPTSRTWSILLCGYLKHGQIEQAETVLTMMQAKGYQIQEVYEKYGSYVPSGYDLRAIAGRVHLELDETKIPEGLEDLLADSASLQGETWSSSATKSGLGQMS